MAEQDNPPVTEFSTEFQERALNSANRYLDSPEAASVKETEWMKTEMDQTITKTIDSSSNTAFHVESCHPAGSADPDAKKTVISWLTLGDEKGDLPSGGIHIIESKGEKQIFAYKLDRPLVSDEGYLWGVSRDMIGRTISDMKPEGQQIPLTEEQASQILARLEASQANKEHTEATAKWMDAENRFSETITEYQRAENANMVERWLRLPAARSKLTDASLKVRETEEEIKKKMKKQNGEETAPNESTS